MRIALTLCYLIGFGLTLAGVALSQRASAELKAAAGKVEITPKKTAFIAGYASNRKSLGAHDPLWARCLVLESGGTRIAFVSCDVIGVPRYQIEKVRAKVKSVKPECLYIAATHTHSGPDTLGQWGPEIRVSGVDQAWLAEFLDKIVQLVETTVPKLEPAGLKFASETGLKRISKNVRVAEILDTELGVMQAVALNGGKPIATFVNYACHPETLNNRFMTADFPHWLYETVEREGGGVCLYLNGAQGGMVTTDFDEDAKPKGENWKEAERIGTTLAERTLALLKGAELLKEAPIRTQRRVFEVPMENPMFKTLIALKVFPGEVMKQGNIETEVCRIQIGPAEFLTLPGEVLPNIGFFLKRQMTGKPKFLLGLTCDELGYILSREDYGLELYKYETSVSVGSQMGPLMTDHLLALLAEAQAKR